MTLSKGSHITAKAQPETRSGAEYCEMLGGLGGLFNGLVDSLGAESILLYISHSIYQDSIALPNCAVPPAQRFTSLDLQYSLPHV